MSHRRDQWHRCLTPDREINALTKCGTLGGVITPVTSGVKDVRPVQSTILATHGLTSTSYRRNKVEADPWVARSALWTGRASFMREFTGGDAAAPHPCVCFCLKSPVGSGGLHHRDGGSKSHFPWVLNAPGKKNKPGILLVNP